MDSLKNKVVERILYNFPDMKAPDATDAVDRAEAYFLGATGRRSLPERAYWTWVDLTIAMIKDDITLTATLDEGVTSVKRGDTQINYEHTAYARTLAMQPKLVAFKVAVMR